MEMAEAVAMVRRIVGDAARESGLPARVTCPAAVWDNTGELIGVSIESPKAMGGKPCMFTASFVVGPEEYASAEGVLKITAKASTAMQAIRGNIQCKVRPVKEKREAA